MGQPQSRLPLTVIGGFLGAGKTTLLNAWLRQAQGQRIAVLVNDFGALNIDAELISAASGDTIALSNGCVCCQIGDDLSRALLQILASGTPFDAIVVEASGVSDPWRIAQLGLADPGLSLGGVIVLVDTAAVLGHLQDPLLADTMERQLQAADLIVLNKVDTVSADVLGQVRARISATCGKTAQFETTQAQVPIALLGALVLPSGAAAFAGSPAHPCGPGCAHPVHTHGGGFPAPDHGGLFQGWSCQPQRIFSAPALRNWLSDPPPGLLRLKGVLRTGEVEWTELQFAGKHVSLRRGDAPKSGAAVVAIGLRGRLPMGALATFFGAEPL